MATYPSDSNVFRIVERHWGDGYTAGQNRILVRGDFLAFDTAAFKSGGAH